jgi:hypothetical protein
VVQSQRLELRQAVTAALVIFTAQEMDQLELVFLVVQVVAVRVLLAQAQMLLLITAVMVD